ALAWLGHGYAVCAVALLACVVLLGLEARRDAELVSKFSCLVAAGYTGIGLIALASDPESRVRSGSFVAVLLLIAIAAGVGWYRLKNQADSVPNVLLEFFGPDSVLEEDEVQWIAVQSSPELTAATTLDIYCQNCC